MPSETQKNQSAAGPDEQATVSVFDFLYYDVTRIASFISQFDPSGHLTGITQTERARRNKIESTDAKTEGTAVVLKGTWSSKTDRLAEMEHGAQRAYDPRWANALTFLDYIDERGLLQRELGAARIGQIVLFSGGLSMFDLSILRKMWDLPAARDTFLNGGGEGADNRQNRRRSERAKTSPRPSKTEFGLEMLTLSPHAVQASVRNEGQSVWMTLKQENLATPPEDLLMKHGLTIAGEWHVLGVLDAMPDPPLSVETLAFDADQATPSQIEAGASLSGMGGLLAPHFAAPVRNLLGRPREAHGVTPLLIFRKIAV